MRGIVTIALALTLGACQASPRASARPVVEAPTLEQLYLAGRVGEVVLLAHSVIDAPNQPRERVAEARFFRALAWLARNPHSNRDRVLFEFRALEFEYADLIWGRLAGHYVADAARIDALQATLLELAVEQRDLLVRIDELEHSLAAVLAKLAERESEVVELERERGDLREQLGSARARAEALAVRLRELEGELAALKQIDMQREP